MALLLIFNSNLIQGQDVVRHVRGKVVDQLSKKPVEGMDVKLSNSENLKEAITDASGNFDIQAPVGRYKLVCYGGEYKTYEQEVLVISGHESNLTILISPALHTLKEVEVTSSTMQDIPGNVRSLSIEKTLRVPANFFDPVRVITAYPGVVAANDQANAIIVRGNSPNGLLWRLNGLDMVNPNHLANAGTMSDIPAANGGGVNILSAQMLDKTDFYVGGFPSNYGNAVAGVVDMKMREGSYEKMQYTAQASLIGLDFAVEGPVGYNNSFVANYRYSTVGLLSNLGVNFGDEAITFQDLSFSSVNNFKKGGSLSFFGFFGASRNKFESPDEREEDKDRYDIDYSSLTFGLGTNFSKPVGKGELVIGALYSSLDQSRDESVVAEIPNNFQSIEENYAIDQSIFSSTAKYKVGIGEKSQLETGFLVNYYDNKFDGDVLRGCESCGLYGFVYSEASSGFLIQPYTHITSEMNPNFTIDAGIRYLTYTYNSTSSLEPRVNLRFKPKASTQVNFSYSLVSQQQLPQLYAVNKDLELTKSRQIDLTLKQLLKNDLTITGGLFYQGLYDVPVSSVQPAFSAINMLEGFAPPFLESEGTGSNYGFDFTIEKLFYSSHYFLFGGSYYESKYKGADGVERDSRWNGNYTINSTYGKEWTKKEKNRTIGLSTRLLYIGGLRESEIDEGLSQASGETYYDRTNPYSKKLPDYFRLDLRLSFRKNKPKYTRTFAIDIQNLTSQQNESYHYYDLLQQKIVTKFQLGIIPVLVYRIDF